MASSSSPKAPSSPSLLASQEQNNEKRIIVLKSNDKELFEVDREVASMSVTLKHMMEASIINIIPLSNVSAKTLSKVLEYCHKHVPGDDKSDQTEQKGKNKVVSEANANMSLADWDKMFVKLHQSDLFEIMLAANYLEIQSLLDLTFQAVADYIKDKSVETVRDIFNVENDFTPEEENVVRNEFAWVFEGVNDK